MKKLLVLGMVVALAFAATATLSAADAADATEIMKQSHLAYYYSGDDGMAKVNMKIVSKSGKERIREFTILRLDVEDGGQQKYYTYFKKPSDVSRLTFMVWKQPGGDDKRWIYMPAIDLIKQISAGDKTASFVNSDFTYEDISGRHWSEDVHTIISESETIDGKEAYLISSKPVKKYKGFAEKKSWIDKKTNLPLREEYFNKKGELQKIFTADVIEEIDGFPTITQRTIKIVKKNKYTTLTFDEITYNNGIGDEIFTERYLKTPPRKYIK